MNEKTEKRKLYCLSKFMENDEAISFQLSVNTEDPDLTKVQLKLVQGAEAHAQGGFGRQGDGVRINHGP